MVPRAAVDESNAVLRVASPKEDRLDDAVGEAHLDTVHGSIASGLG